MKYCRWFPVIIAIVVGCPSAAVFAKMLKSKHTRVPSSAPVERVEAIQARVDTMTEELRLSEKQKEQVKDILTRARDERNRLMTEAAEKMTETNDNAAAGVEAILTPEQKNKFRGVEENNDEDAARMFE